MSTIAAWFQHTLTEAAQAASPRELWCEWMQDRFLERHLKFAIPVMRERRKDRTAADVAFKDAFPVSRELYPEHPVGAAGCVYDATEWFTDYWADNAPTMLIGRREVPAWTYGFVSHQNNTGLPENGSYDEIKDGIFAVMEECAASVAKRVGDALKMYEMQVLTCEVDLLCERITMHVLAFRPVMQVNTIMCNKVIRQAMPPRARICVNTYVEEGRRTDDYLKHKPDRQEISREFYYEDGQIVRDEPQHWSAGMKHETGDILRIGSIAHRIEEETSNAWRGMAYDGDPVAGRNDPRRVQMGTAFKPGERVHWHARRNR